MDMRSLPHLPQIREMYDQFNALVTDIDCGLRCAPFNPAGKPFCCDICHAVPAVYRQEWDYLKVHTNLWHVWQGTECPADATDADELRASMPAHMLLLACLGPQDCQRPYRALSCRQFPFFPYINSRDRFVGLTIEWEYWEVCWVLNHLNRVTVDYRREFIRTYDRLFGLWEEEFDAYALRSEEIRDFYGGCQRRFPLLHRNGKDYLVSPGSDRLERVDLNRLAQHGFWENNNDAA
jgi:hypothetical protein